MRFLNAICVGGVHGEHFFGLLVAFLDFFDLGFEVFSLENHLFLILFFLSVLSDLTINRNDNYN